MGFWAKEVLPPNPDISSGCRCLAEHRELPLLQEIYNLFQWSGKLFRYQGVGNHSGTCSCPPPPPQRLLIRSNVLVLLLKMDGFKYVLCIIGRRLFWCVILPNILAQLQLCFNGASTEEISSEICAQQERIILNQTMVLLISH